MIGISAACVAIAVVIRQSAAINSIVLDFIWDVSLTVTFVRVCETTPPSVAGLGVLVAMKIASRYE